MSDDLMPAWGLLLKKQVADLERRLNEQATAAGSATVTDGPNVEQTASEPGVAKATGADNAETEKRRQELEALEHEIQSVQMRLDQARKETEAAEQGVEGERRRTEETRAALEARAAAVKAGADQLDTIRRVIERIWPRFMLTEPFGKWKSAVEAALLEEIPPSSAALLFANLHGYTACLLENDLKYLRDVLRDISRFLYAWLKETGQGEHAAFETALAWAAAFNEECAGRCEIEVPEPGNPANNVSMTFPPRGSSPEVVSVRTWCVRDAQRRVIHRAEVFT